MQTHGDGIQSQIHFGLGENRFDLGSEHRLEILLLLCSSSVPHDESNEGELTSSERFDIRQAGEFFLDRPLPEKRETSVYEPDGSPFDRP